MADHAHELFHKLWPKIVAKAWSDPQFKAQFKENPKQVLATYGIEVPQEIDLEVIEDTEQTHYILLPSKPEGELSEKSLADIAAGTASGSSTGVWT
ncbi:MAG: hypothetical protein S4CHLAM123_04910 [Chlamydiales bacterium]|nr:hypothetical protein [Chlamydiales bacterium]